MSETAAIDTAAPPPRPRPAPVRPDPAAAPSLVDLTARVWDAGVAVDTVCAERGGAAVAFGLADGSVALAAAADPEPAARRVRIAGDTGRVSLAPRAGLYAPLEMAELGARQATALVPAGSGRAFLALRSDGRLVRITRRGQVVDLGTPFGRRIDAIAAHPAAPVVALASGADLVIGPEDAPGDGTALALGSHIAALAFGADGRQLAAATAERVVVIADGRIAHDVALAGARRLAISPGGAFLAAALRQGIALLALADGRVALLPNYPAAVRSLAWSRPANALATSGAFRAAAWSMASPPFADPAHGALRTGRSGVIVECVAAHPRRPLLAIGRADGSVTLAPIGSPDEMGLVPAGGGAVTALDWTGEADDLAIGRADGMAAVASLPPTLFK